MLIAMTIDTRKALGSRIRQLRKANNLSQQKLALMVNVERSYLAKLEQGIRNPTIDCLEKIAGGLDVTLSELLAGVDAPLRKDARPAGQRHVEYGFIKLPPAKG